MALVGRFLARAGPRCVGSGASAPELSSLGHRAGLRRDFGSGDTSGSDEIEEFLDYHLSKQSDAPGTFRQSVATTRRESLSLYRDILRFSRFFTWPDANGRPFRESIRESARKEYEAARFEKDPQIINKLIVSGRDCLEKSLQNVIDKQRQIIEDQRKSGPPDNGI